MILVLLPLISFPIFLGVILTRYAFRQAFASAAIAWGVTVFAATEVLSAFNCFTRAGIATAWVAVDLAALIWLWRSSGHFSKDWRLSLRRTNRGRVDPSPDIPYGLIGGCLFIVSVTGVIALLRPPNTSDVLGYHLPRVVYWLENRNVGDYPALYSPQLYMPPWAEYAMAHLYALGRGDHFVNLVQWFSLLGCGIVSSWIAGLLGAPGRGQVLAAAVSISIPQGILQSSGAKNDYVVAFWIACCIGFVLAFKKEPNRRSAAMIGLSGGLALLTKGTAYIYIPAIIALLWLAWPHKLQARLLLWLPLAALLAASLNVHQWLRNHDFCGGLAGCPFADYGENYRFENERVSAGVTISNIIRNAALHLGTPSEAVDSKLTDVASEAIKVLGLDPSDPGSMWPGARFVIQKPQIHEDVMGNPIHLLLIFAVICALPFEKRRNIDVLMYAGGLTLAFILFCAYLRWQPWHTRLHLPLFVLWSAAAGVVFGSRLRLPQIEVWGIVLLMFSTPAVFNNALAPLLSPGTGAWDTNYGAPPTYGALAGMVDRASCRSVGIDARSVFVEYPLLKYLRAGLGERSVWQTALTNQSSKYAARLGHAKPECMLCANCPQDGEQWRSYVSEGMTAVPAQDFTFFYRRQLSSLEHYRMLVHFPAAQDPKPMSEPLLTFGRFGAADFFYARYLGSNRISLGFHHFWVGGPESSPVVISPDTDYPLEIIVDDKVGTVNIVFNGALSLNHVSPIYPHSKSEVYIGRNPIGGAACGPVFTGNIIVVSSL